MNTTAKVLKIEQIGSAIRRHHTQRETLIVFAALAIVSTPDSAIARD